MGSKPRENIFLHLCVNLLFVYVSLLSNECLPLLYKMPPRRLPSARKEVARKRRQALENATIVMANWSTTLSNGKSIFDRFDRHRSPSFDGTFDPIVLEGWIREMEKLFAANGCPSAEMVSIGTYNLKLEADNWWNTVCVYYKATPIFGWITLELS